MRYFLPAFLALLVVSCADNTPHSGGSGGNNNYETVEDAYDLAFGALAGGDYSGCSFNLSMRYSTEINPGDNRTVKIYALIDGEYRLVADYKNVVGPTDVVYDAQYDLTSILVEIGDCRYVVSPDDRVDYYTTPVRQAPVNISDQPFTWIFAVENDFRYQGRKDKLDFDFNDVLLRITAIATDDGMDLTLYPLACGDDEPLYLHFFDGVTDKLLWPDYSLNLTDAEFHQWFGVQDDMTRVNTGAFYDDNDMEVIYNGRGGWASQVALARNTLPCTLKLSDNWSMQNLSQLQRGYDDKILGYSGLYITVGSFKPASKLLNDNTVGIIGAEAFYHAPRVLIFPNVGSKGAWQWPTETTGIDYVFADFSNYCVNPDDPGAYLWYSYPPSDSKLVY